MDVFCTIYEGDYHYGVAALLNSLVQAEFKGAFVIGYRGEQPPWLDQLTPSGTGRWRLGDIEVILDRIETTWLLAHVKPRFMLEILDRVVPEAQTVAYADPDIVVNCPWSFFQAWMARGVALSEDFCFVSMSPNHYLRRCWRDYIEHTLHAQVARDAGGYYNSGFAGARRADRDFLVCWQRALEGLTLEGVDMERLKPGTRFDAFSGTDQDALNMAAMMAPNEICSLGPEGMGYAGGMHAMLHATDGVKPWRKRYFLQSIREGCRVSQAHRAYWQMAGGPLKAWSKRSLALHRLDMRLAVILSRFYHAA